MKSAALTASIASALVLSAGAPPARIQLLAMGDQDTRNGVPPKVVVRDRAHAEAIAAESMRIVRNAPIVIDYDHQTVRAFATGGRAIAAGWMTKIIGDDHGVWAEVDWNEAAASAIRAGEYRYISPYFRHRADGSVTRIINAGLTNTPNLDLQALASAEVSTEEDDDSMTFKAIAAALGLAATADEAAILAAITAKNDAMTATASALGITLADDPQALVAAATAAKSANPDPARFVAVEDVTALATSLTEVKDELAELKKGKRADLIAAASASGKLPPALKAHAESLDDAALASFLGALPETSLGKKTLAGDPDPERAGALTDDQIALCTTMGWDQAAYLETLKEEAA